MNSAQSKVTSNYLRFFEPNVTTRSVQSWQHYCEQLFISEPSIPIVKPDSLSEASINNQADASVATLAHDQTVAKLDDETPVTPFFERMKAGLSRTRSGFAASLAQVLLGKKAIDDDMLEEIETLLLTADVGITVTKQIVSQLTERLPRNVLDDPDMLFNTLKEVLHAILQPVEQPLQITKQNMPYVILIVGVNGVGKTTTIGKLAKRLQSEGHRVTLAAGDTFRAAAVEQLQVWGERNDVPVVAQHTGADSASVIYDALASAQAKSIDVLIADTAGRLHNKDNLMEELKKVRRVMAKLDANAPHEVMLVVDAGTGQNALNQAKQFNQAVTLSGVALTKLDGTAKGGIAFALAGQLGLPIRFVGVGEQIDDLRPFDAKEFIEALFDRVN